MKARPQHTPRHSVSVAGVILDATASRVLLIQRRDNGRWEPPGGVLELDEPIETGLRREIEEETGVDITVDGLTGVYKNMNRGIIALVFRCSALTEPRPASPEAAAIAWLPVTEVEDLMDSAYSVRVMDAIRSRAVSIRAHDGTRLVADGGR
jgi:8-oxo-dGTP diphosphatase